MIGLISATQAGASASARLAAAWPGRTRAYDGPVRDAVERAFGECSQVVCFLATGAVVRLVAPLLSDKASDPGVVCVDEAGRFAVALVGGHEGGANALALDVADVLGAQAVVTTATDAVDVPGLDMLGLPVEGDVAGVSRALLDGESVVLDASVSWPLPPLPPNVRHAAPSAAPTLPQALDSARAGGTPLALRHDCPQGGQDPCIRVTDQVVVLGDREVVLRPPSLVVGVGASKGAPVEEVLGLVRDALRDAGLSPASLAELATVDAKAEEPGIVGAAETLGVPLVTYSAEELARIDVPNPSGAPLAAVGTPSVAEAAALVRGGELLVPKRKSAPEGRAAMATCAVVRRAPRG
ncbi:cobalamin biosynthesis protein, partial [Streptomyces sp. T-3]|nr:cobalamin biosynthesis protein [Streptomyces sp. T-3]